MQSIVIPQNSRIHKVSLLLFIFKVTNFISFTFVIRETKLFRIHQIISLQLIDETSVVLFDRIIFVLLIVYYCLILSKLLLADSN